MRIHKQFFKSIALATLLCTGFAANGIAQDSTTIVNPETKAPVILTATPTSGAMNVDLSSVIEITFSNEMDGKSINGTTLMLHASYADTTYEEHSEMMDGQIRDRSEIKESQNSWKYTTGAVSGTISYSNKVAVFTPDSELKEGTLYTFTVTNEVKNLENIPLENAQNWNFTTTGTSNSSYFGKQNDRNGMGGTENSSRYATSKNDSSIIDLGKAGHFVILAKKDINNESGSNITGHIGEGSQANSNKSDKDTTKPYSGQESVMKSEQSDTTSPPSVTDAIEVLASTFNDVSMHQSDEVTTHNTESFHHNPALEPGVHEWNSSIQIMSDVTLSGSADDVWIFKTDSNLTVFENTVITLTDGAQADNVFWYVEGEVSIGKQAEFEGIILSMNEITLEKGAIVNGRMFSQSSVTLDDNTITEPRKMTGQTTSKNE